LLYSASFTLLKMLPATGGTGDSAPATGEPAGSTASWSVVGSSTYAPVQPQAAASDVQPQAAASESGTSAWSVVQPQADDDYDDGTASYAQTHDPYNEPQAFRRFAMPAGSVSSVAAALAGLTGPVSRGGGTATGGPQNPGSSLHSGGGTATGDHSGYSPLGIATGGHQGPGSSLHSGGGTATGDHGNIAIVESVDMIETPTVHNLPAAATGDDDDIPVGGRPWAWGHARMGCHALSRRSGLAELLSKSHASIGQRHARSDLFFKVPQTRSSSGSR
jgi:hypothetical protein